MDNKIGLNFTMQQSDKMGENVYSKKSLIPNIGNGLFAKNKISAGTNFVEFMGKLIRPNSKQNTNPRSTVMFFDGWKLSCTDDDIASFANDCVNMSHKKENRKLLKALRQNKPFYSKHKNVNLNSQIILDDVNHKAYLQAITDIDVDEECWTHYGFNYWFMTEAQRGFIVEEEIVKKGFCEKIFEYPAFKMYLKEFYPESTGYEITEGLNSEHCVKILFNNSCIWLDIPDCKNMFLFGKICN